MLEKRYRRRSPGFVRKVRSFFYNLIIIIKILAFIGLIYFGSRLYIENKDSYLNFDFIQKIFINFSAKNGFILQNVFLEGQEYTSTQDILNKLSINTGDPIFSISVKQIKENIETIAWVRTAVIERQFPGDLYIGISERVPIGIGQYNKQLFLFDEEGVKIDEKNLKPFLDLPVVICEDLGLYINTFYDIIKKDKDLYRKIISVIRIGERRWNIRFNNDIEVKLPENNIEEAWNRLIILKNNNELFNDNIASIDLRIANKIFVERKQ